MSEWFITHNLALNVGKTNVIQFKTNNTPQYDLSIGYNEKYWNKSVNMKFLGLQIDNQLNWKKSY
jgi:hypothetical protein